MWYSLQAVLYCRCSDARSFSLCLLSMVESIEVHGKLTLGSKGCTSTNESKSKVRSTLSEWEVLMDKLDTVLVIDSNGKV